MNGISENARHAREGARKNDGKFGSYELSDAGTEADLDMGFLNEDAPGSSFGERRRLHEHETPVQVDTQLDELYRERVRLDQNADSALYRVHIKAGDRKSYYSRSRASWGMSDQAAIDAVKAIAASESQPEYIRARARDHLARLANIEAQIRQNAEAAKELDAEFEARGGWSRSFIAQSADGHAHSSMSCPTCNRRGKATQFAWMTDYSGKSQEEIVAAAGWRACTVCYPSAPVGDPRTLPSTMLTPEEKAQTQERDKRESEKAAKQTKAAANAPTITGEPIEVHDHLFTRPSSKTLKTERAAQMWWVEQWEPEDLARASSDAQQRYDAKKAELDHVVEQLAVKQGIDVEELRASLRAKAIKKNGYRWGM